MSKLYAYLMCSRNKDNKDIPNFKQRRKSILEYEEHENRIKDKFDKFVADGVPGEKSRLYKSVNARDEDKIRKSLIIKLIKDEPSMTKLNSILASVAQQCENRAESKWLFDFDEKNEELFEEFLCDIPCDTLSYETPNGYAAVVEHGFDTRKLMDKWKDYDITLKRDELLFMSIKENKGGFYK